MLPQDEKKKTVPAKKKPDMEGLKRKRISVVCIGGWYCKRSYQGTDGWVDGERKKHKKREAKMNELKRVVF